MDLSEDDWRRWTLALATQPSLPKNLMTWVTGPMRDFFAFERCYLCHGQLSAGRIQITHSLSHGHSDEYLQQLHEQYEAPLRGTVTHWLKTREPFYMCSTSKRMLAPTSASVVYMTHWALGT